jgi:lipid A 3-O-deacylase
VTVRISTEQILVFAAIAVAALAARPAAAQLSVGSPGEPPRLELGVGAFDITPSHRPDAGTEGDFRAEYHFGDVLVPYFSPFLGADVTTEGGSYVYGGFGIDINLTPNIVVTPNEAVSWYQRGNGSVLGSWVEFRSGIEIDYKFEDQSRLGVAVHHMSNAGLTQINPGEQSVLLVYQLPLR